MSTEPDENLFLTGLPLLHPDPLPEAPPVPKEVPDPAE